MPEYPTEILPYESYRPLMDVDKLAADVEGACVVRRVSERPCVSEVLGVKCFENYDILQASDILDMSSSLLGGRYQNAHLPFVDKSGRFWMGQKTDEITAALDDETNWTYIEEPSFPLMLCLSKLHLHSFPYHRSFANQKLEKEFEEKYKIAKFYQEADKTASYTFTIRFHHVPTLLNYWHFEMKLYPSADEAFPRKDAKKTWMKTILGNFINVGLLAAIVQDEEDVSKIDESYYLKTL